MANQAHILSGYRVLDFTQVVAGPTVTRLMAEMGAEVIKVELAPGGDLARLLPFIRDGRSGYFVQQNRGKQSLCVDARSAEGRQILRELAGTVDVLVESFAPGAIGRLGLDWDTVHALNPRLVMCSISAFGQTGPMAGLPGYDYIAQAYAGFTDLIGEGDHLLHRGIDRDEIARLLSDRLEHCGDQQCVRRQGDELLGAGADGVDHGLVGGRNHLAEHGDPLAQLVRAAQPGIAATAAEAGRRLAPGGRPARGHGADVHNSARHGRRGGPSGR